jgi:hypothetical protein
MTRARRRYVQSLVVGADLSESVPPEMLALVDPRRMDDETRTRYSEWLARKEREALDAATRKEVAA